MINHTQRDKEIVALVRESGLTLGQIGQRYGLSRQRIFQIVQRQLKRQYVLRAGVTLQKPEERMPYDR